MTTIASLLDHLIYLNKYDNNVLFKEYNSELINTTLIKHDHDYPNTYIDVIENNEITLKVHNDIIKKIVHADPYTNINHAACIECIISNPFWLFVHQVLGSNMFLSLFQSFSIYAYCCNTNTFIRLSGPHIDLSFYTKHKGYSMAFKRISLQGWLSNKIIKSYHNYHMIVNFDELSSFMDSKNIDKIKNNHENKINHHQLIKSLCSTNAQLNVEMPNTLNSVVKTEKIIKYFKIVTDKLLNGIFDPHVTKTIKPFIFKTLKTVLNHNLNQFITLKDLNNDLALSVKKSKLHKNCSQLIKFVDWILLCYYPNLMKYSFFGLTFTSRDDVMFYRHTDAHIFISSKTNHFLKSHFTIHKKCEKWQSNNKTKSILVHDLSNGYYHCNIKPVLKDLKKLNNFRFLSIPDKLLTFNSYSRHLTFNMKYIKPTNKILTHLRYTILPSLYQTKHPNKKKNILVQNISEIMLHFNRFIKENRYSTLNKEADLYYLKFDVKNSYDSIPLELLNTILTNMFKEIGLDKIFNLSKEESISFSQSVNTSNKRIAEFKTISKLTVDNDKLVLPSKKPKLNNHNRDISVSNSIRVYQSSSKTSSLSLQEVQDIVRKEIFETITCYSNACYKRVKGLAQGMYLSPILSNIFYDDMIHSTPDLLFSETHKSFFIRFMDDFLMISEDYMLLKSIQKKLINNQLFDKKFQVFVNLEKMEFCKKKNETFEFVGLEFNLNKRTVRKKVEQTMNLLNYNHIKTFKDIYNKLIMILEIRLNTDYTMQIEANSIETIQRQTLLICDNVFSTFVGFLNTVSMDIIKNTKAFHFKKFVINVINLFSYHINRMNNFDYFNEKNFYRLRQLVYSLETLIALQFIFNLKSLNSNRTAKFIDVLQKIVHNEE